MEKRWQPWIAFTVCAAVASFSSAVAITSHGSDEHWYGTMVAVFSGLTAVVLPVLMVLQRQK